MQSKASTVDEYISQVSPDQHEAMVLLRKTIQENIPAGFAEEMSYGMIGYVVPFSLYPKGYRSNPKLPLPFINLAAQKNFIALYYMGMVSPVLQKWFAGEYPKHSKLKLDMGKGCIRFKNISQIPYTLIGELVQKMEASEWVTIYESYYGKNK